MRQGVKSVPGILVALTSPGAGGRESNDKERLQPRFIFCWPLHSQNIQLPHQGNALVWTQLQSCQGRADHRETSPRVKIFCSSPVLGTGGPAGVKSSSLPGSPLGMQQTTQASALISLIYLGKALISRLSQDVPEMDAFKVLLSAVPRTQRHIRSLF